MKLSPATREDYDVLFELLSEIQTMHYDGMPDFFKPAKKDVRLRGGILIINCLFWIINN